MGFVFLSIFNLISRVISACDASFDNWIWLPFQDLSDLYSEIFSFLNPIQLWVEIFHAYHDPGPSYYGIIQFYYSG